MGEHPIFGRQGANLLCELPVTYSAATLGGEAEVPLLGGETATIEITRGTQGGDILRVPGKGLRYPGGRGRGDLLVEVALEVPRKLTERQEELLRELAEIEGAHVSEKRKSFIERLKEYVQSMARSVSNEGKDR